MFIDVWEEHIAFSLRVEECENISTMSEAWGYKLSLNAVFTVACY